MNKIIIIFVVIFYYLIIQNCHPQTMDCNAVTFIKNKNDICEVGGAFPLQMGVTVSINHKNLSWDIYDRKLNLHRISGYPKVISIIYIYEDGSVGFESNQKAIGLLVIKEHHIEYFNFKTKIFHSSAEIRQRE